MERRANPVAFTIQPQIRRLPLKRGFDLLFSSLALLLGLPVYLTIALLVKASSKGSIFYKQKRVGRGGIPFWCYKFRTMDEGADAKLKREPKLWEEWEKHRKIKEDPRVTGVGRFLRKTSFDELPQFWNVLKGELSVVGPRPVTEEEIVEEYGPYASRLLTVRPGITGVWQVSGRSNTTYAERIQYDMDYIKNQSFFLDLLLILKTIPVLVFARGAC